MENDPSPVWASGRMVWPSTKKGYGKLSRRVPLGVSVSHGGVHWAVGCVAGTQKGDVGDKNLRAVYVQLVTEARELHQAQKEGPRTEC